MRTRLAYSPGSWSPPWVGVPPGGGDGGEDEPARRPRLAVVPGEPADADDAAQPGEQQVDVDVGDGFDWTGFLLAFRGVSLEGLEVAVIVVAFGAADHAIASAAIGAVASVLLVGALGAASYRLVARIPRRALQLFVGALLTTFGTFWAAEGLGADWPGGDLALLWLGAFYVAAALVLVRVVSYWRQGTPRRLRAAAPLTEWRSR